MNISAYLNMGGLETRFQMQNINCGLKSPQISWLLRLLLSILNRMERKKPESFAELCAIVNVVIVNTNSNSLKNVEYLVSVTCLFPVEPLSHASGYSAKHKG